MGIKEKEKSLKQKCFQETLFVIPYMVHYISKLYMEILHHRITIITTSKEYIVS